MARGLQVFEKIETGKFVYEEDLKHMTTIFAKI